jgi:hypothetical protein
MATGSFQINFGTITGAATTTLVAADATPTTCKVREFRLWCNGVGAFRLSDGTVDLIQGVTGAAVGAPDGGNFEIGLAANQPKAAGGVAYVIICQGSNRPLNLITTGAGATFGGSIQYDLV